MNKHNLDGFDEVRSAAIRFVLNNRNVHAACLTFVNFDYVKGNLELSGAVSRRRTATHFPHLLTVAEPFTVGTPVVYVSLAVLTEFP